MRARDAGSGSTANFTGHSLRSLLKAYRNTRHAYRPAESGVDPSENVALRTDFDLPIII